MQNDHPALKSSPRSLREALTHIASCAKEELPVVGMFRDEFNCSAIGAFFTWDQLYDIEAQGLNEAGVAALVEYIGEQNLTAMTGLTLEQALAIERGNNESPGQLAAEIHYVLANGGGAISGLLFQLERH